MSKSKFYRARRLVRYKIIHTIRHTRFYPWFYRSHWRSYLKSNKPVRTVTHYMTAKPHHGAGIGHQLANWIAGYHYARFFGCIFAHSPFSDPKWDNLLGFGENEPCAKALKASGLTAVRLPLFDENSPSEVERVKNIIDSYKHQVLFILEDDQFFGPQFIVSEPLAKKFRHANLASFARPLGAPPLRIAVHIRRGDVDQYSENPNIRMRWLENDYFESVMAQISSVMIDMPVEIELFSQGPFDADNFPQFGDLRLRTDDSPYESFRDMASADILVTSKSSFSYKAALLARGIRIVPRNFWHGYPDDPLWICAGDDGSLDKGKLRSALDALDLARTEK